MLTSRSCGQLSCPNMEQEPWKSYTTWYLNPFVRSILILLVLRTKNFQNLWRVNMSQKTFQYLSLTSQVMLSWMLPYIIYVMDLTIVSSTRIRTWNLTSCRSLNFSLTKLAQAFPLANIKISNISSAFILTSSTKTFSALLITLTKSYKK